MICPACEKAQTQLSGTYQFNCSGCRTRFIQSEPCKYFRKVLVEHFSKKYGEFLLWQEGKNCGCERICKRKAAVGQNQQMERIHEQPINRNGTKTSRRR